MQHHVAFDLAFLRMAGLMDEPATERRMVVLADRPRRGLVRRLRDAFPPAAPGAMP